MLTFEQIKELIELVAQRRLQGLELERAGFRLKIDGQPQAQPVVYAAAPPEGASSTSQAQPAAMPMASTDISAAPAAAPAPEEGAHVVNSPIVGTFYRASSPDADPFVDVGSRVKKGQVLCIIEAMKLMNEIESDVDGVVAKIYPQNAQAVEYGEPLFAIQSD
ncbi:MAG TPA: acetyl-CoA carboxylase biotin carboxyl carrier protein [Thermoanaerobaculia bacterium]|nr:acetyl-CoA carboxylase biotin carboxyl carrier protein [Thermoanaerobaculia bacterium]